MVLGFALFSCGDDPCTHKDKNDDESCDICGASFTDGCDNHRDSDDDNKCDHCETTFTDKCDKHRDADDDNKCDYCGTDPLDTGLGKVVIGEGTTFTAPEGIVKAYDRSAIEAFDGTSSGIYLAEGCTLEKTESGFKAVKA